MNTTFARECAPGRAFCRVGMCLALLFLFFFPPSGAVAASLFNCKERSATEADAWYRKINPLWQRVLQAEKESPGFTADGRHMTPGDALTWRNLLKAADSMPRMELIRLVNGYFNQWRPKADDVTWGQDEHWATLREFFAQRGGDCEDYAIAKYFALRYLNFNGDAMRIVVVRMQDEKGKFREQLHAVLAIYAKGTWFILDNNARPKDNIFPHTMYKGKMLPIFSINEKGAWLHATPTAKSDLAKPTGGIESDAVCPAFCLSGAASPCTPPCSAASLYASPVRPFVSAD